MKLALHRSLAFWLGLLTMSFLAWAWRDSGRQETAGCAGPFMLRSVWGGVVIDSATSSRGHDRFFRIPDGTYRGFFTHTPETFPPPLFLRRADLSQDEIRELRFRDVRGQFTVREYMKMKLHDHAPTQWLLYLPYWLLMLLTAILTAALLFWRARRRRTQTTNNQ